MNTKSSNIRYNYYSIECMNIVNSVNNDTKLRTITSSFRGKVNNPNIIYKKNNININYQATKLYINGKIHDMDDGLLQDGEIVILHQPTTTALKLYCCIPYKESSKISKTVVDDLINSESHSMSNIYQDLPLSIELNKYISGNPSVSEYETIDVFGEHCTVIFFHKAIKIKQHLEGKQLEKALFNVGLEKSHVSVIEDNIKSSSTLMGWVYEGFRTEDDRREDERRESERLRDERRREERRQEERREDIECCLYNYYMSSQRKIFLTFGGPTANFHNRVVALSRQAETLRVFDEVRGITDLELKESHPIFWDEHNDFLMNNKRGYGFWFWKPYIIRATLHDVETNDIVIYMDAGCTINLQGKERHPCIHYFKLLTIIEDVDLNIGKRKFRVSYALLKRDSKRFNL
jgi:hypothetical protein